MLGFLRESQVIADKAGLDKDTNICRTGLDTYLQIIFPNITDWVHDKCIPKDLQISNEYKRVRPDYRSESLKMIIEFDGLPHYTDPDCIGRDEENTKFYESIGYKVIRIPYFIQLTKSVVNILFNVDINKDLFDENIPSLGLKSGNPSYLCIDGIKRMAKEYRKFPEQYKINIQYLKNNDKENKTYWRLLEAFYNDEDYLLNNHI